MRLEPNTLLIALPLCFILLFIFLIILCFCFFACLTGFGQDLCSCLVLDFFYFFFWTVVTFFVVAMDAPQGLGYPDAYVPWSLCLCRQQRHIFTGWAWSTRSRQVVRWLCWPKVPITYMLYFYASMVQPQSHCKFPSWFCIVYYMNLKFLQGLFLSLFLGRFVCLLLMSPCLSLVFWKAWMIACSSMSLNLNGRR